MFTVHTSWINDAILRPESRKSQEVISDVLSYKVKSFNKGRGFLVGAGD